MKEVEELRDKGHLVYALTSQASGKQCLVGLVIAGNSFIKTDNS